MAFETEHSFFRSSFKNNYIYIARRHTHTSEGNKYRIYILKLILVHNYHNLLLIFGQMHWYCTWKQWKPHHYMNFTLSKLVILVTHYVFLIVFEDFCTCFQDMVTLVLCAEIIPTVLHLYLHFFRFWSLKRLNKIILSVQ